jgi:hypothetical protein
VVAEDIPDGAMFMRTHDQNLNTTDPDLKLGNTKEMGFESLIEVALRLY